MYDEDGRRSVVDSVARTQSIPLDERVRMLRALDAAGADLDRRGAHARPLFSVATAGHAEAVEALLAAGADPERKATGLLGAGADPTARAVNGQTALDVHEAADCIALPEKAVGAESAPDWVLRLPHRTSMPSGRPRCDRYRPGPSIQRGRPKQATDEDRHFSPAPSPVFVNVEPGPDERKQRDDPRVRPRDSCSPAVS